MVDELNLSMFRAYDIRTPAQQLTPDLARRLNEAEAKYFREVLGASSVLVGHDARRTGPAYLTIAVETFRQAGLDVICLPGVSSTSYFYYAAMRHPESAAVMIGASHNPACDTGQKIVGPGVEPIAANIGPGGGLDTIRQWYEAGATCRGRSPGRVWAVEWIDDYIAHSMALAEVEAGGLRGLRIFQDYLFGAAGREMMLAFERAGADLSPCHFAADGDFPLGDPNPVKEKVIAPGLAVFGDGGFDLANFFDGDGDRIDFYHGDGNYLASSFVYAALLPEIQRARGSRACGVFADLKSNPRAVIEMARTGLAVDVIRNGHSQIKQSLFHDPAKLGAVEESAHFYEAFVMGGRRFCTENTLYFALLAARVWLQDRGRVEHLLEIQGTTVREREWGYKFLSDQQRAAALQAVQEYFQSQGAGVMQRMANGMDLEATLMRRGLPFDVDANTCLADDWLQVCQRVSQSEDRLARWEVVGADGESVAAAKREIGRCVATFGIGEEYRG